MYIMKIAVIGSRGFEDYIRLEEVLNELNQIECIISGGAKGADRLAEVYADANGIPKKIFPAQWGTHGRAAGMIRNKDIVDASDLVIAFWDGASRGTKHTIEYSKKKGVPVKVIRYDINTLS